MKDKKLIVAIVVAVVILGVAAFFVLGGSDNKDTQQSQGAPDQASQSQNEQSSDQSNKGNLQTLNASGKTQKCTMKYSGEGGSSEGIMYSDGNGRGLMTTNMTTEQGNTGTANTLMTADKVYSWTTTNGQTMGFVFDKSTFEAQQSTTSDSSETSKTPDPNQNFELNCSSWDVDESILSPPSNVNFSSLPIQQ